MILHIVDQMNGIPFTKRAQHLLTDEEVEAYFEMTKVIFMGTPDFSTKGIGNVNRRTRRYRSRNAT